MVTADTNIVFYALTQNAKSAMAEQALAKVDFLSVQVLNEYANASRRKRRREWSEIQIDIELLTLWANDIRPVSQAANADAMRVADRYQLAFYDSLMIAVALANGATTLYSEDMQHGMVIDGTLTITNPFLTQPEST
jgi:predicted nucleic acid-binding protein